MYPIISLIPTVHKVNFGAFQCCNISEGFTFYTKLHITLHFLCPLKSNRYDAF